MQRINPALSGVSALGVLRLIFMAMSLPRNKMLFENESLLLAIALPVFIYYVSFYLVSSIWSVKLARKGAVPGDKSVVLVYTSVARHINICMALVMSTFTLEQAASMVICLIMAYIIQVVSMEVFAQKAGVRIVAMGKDVQEVFN